MASVFKTGEKETILWLGKELEINPEKIFEMVKMIREGFEMYEEYERKKKNGATRKISKPIKPLLTIQNRINKSILRFQKPGKNVFGFSGGCATDAIRPHLKANSILCVDFKDAFPSVSKKAVFELLFGKNKGGGIFYFHAAKIVAELVAHNDALPQGAPTSPRIFDLVCKPLDKRLNDLAEMAGGRYTRYADNIFFSFRKEKFPRKVKRQILRIIEGDYEHASLPHFKCHKLKVRSGEQLVRILGLNVINHAIHNTREYKRRIRKAIHHVEWLKSNGMDIESGLNKLRGLMSFAQKDTLPPLVIQKFKELNNPG